MDIEDWRGRIDEIDDAMVEILSRRMACSLEIGRLKRELGKPIHVPDRESAILDRVERLNPGPLKGEAIRRIFQQIIEESRRLEQERSGPEEG
jgi:chorismate mutase